MFLHKKSLINIKEYLIQSNDILFNINNKLYHDGKIIETDIYEFYYFIKKIVVNKKGKMVIIDLQNNSKKEFEQRTIVNYNYSFYDEQIFIYNRDKKSLLLKNLTTIEEKQLLSYYYWEFIYKNEKSVIFYDRNTLKSLYILTGNHEWQLDLGGYKYLRHGREEEGKIDKIIGLWEHQLLVAMSDEKLVSVDIHTGKVLWKTSNFNNTYLPDWRNRSMFRMAYWLIETGKLYQLDGNVYYSIDLETQQFDLLWHNANDENELTIVHKTYTEDYIYFTGAYHYQLSPNLVGVFNRKTLTIDWITAVENLTGSLNQPPQVADDKLYVLDTGGTLHIFAREAPNN